MVRVSRLLVVLISLAQNYLVVTLPEVSTIVKSVQKGAHIHDAER